MCHHLERRRLGRTEPCRHHLEHGEQTPGPGLCRFVVQLFGGGEELGGGSLHLCSGLGDACGEGEPKPLDLGGGGDTTVPHGVRRRHRALHGLDGTGEVTALEPGLPGAQQQHRKGRVVRSEE